MDYGADFRFRGNDCTWASPSKQMTTRLVNDVRMNDEVR